MSVPYVLPYKSVHEVPNISVMYTLKCRQVDKTTRRDLMKESISCKTSEQVGWTNGMKLGKKHRWKVLYRICSFRFDPLTNMVATGNSCLRLVNF
jgi:hypothetical protein